MSEVQRTVFALTLFAIAMAYVESAVVVYLRSIYYPDGPLVIFPLSLLTHRDLAIEVGRELATIIMILCVASVAARGFTRIFAAFVYVFGLWDIFYYLWLKILIGWPVTWLEWDALFLIPWPWFGPWLTAALVSLLFVIWGGWVLLLATDARFTRDSGSFFAVGALLVLGAFLWPAVPLLPEGEEAFRNFHPGTFLWGLYVMGYVLMAFGLWRFVRRNSVANQKRDS